ncbi:inositol hexakis phosphate kinase Ip6k3 [Acrasis kona]|uniref:Kinase n=1 Tax=Acrasis kona TaxID=1008807 RepID=A0AAW2ZL25_9EUKA
MSQPQYPLLKAENLAKPNHRVAGHDTFLSDGESIYKLVDSKKPQINEIKFYTEQLNKVPMLKRFVPEFKGIYSLWDKDLGQHLNYMCLQDLTKEYTNPTIIDLKMGTKTYQRDASPTKVAHELHKNPHQELIGFRVSGLRSFNKKTQQSTTEPDRYALMRMEKDQVFDFLKNKFLYNGESTRTDILTNVISELQYLKQTFETENNSFIFLCSSLLIIYEGDTTKSSKSKVAMIDFAHVMDLIESEKRDEGYIYGLNTLIQMLSDIKI